MRTLIAVLLLAPIPALAAGGSLVTTALGKQGGLSQPMRDRLRRALSSDTQGVTHDSTPLHARGVGSLWSAHSGTTTVGANSVEAETTHHSFMIPVDMRQQRARTRTREAIEVTQRGSVIEARFLTRERSALQGNGYNGFKPEGRERSVSLRTERVRSLLRGAIQLRTVQEETRTVDARGKREVTTTPSRQLTILGRTLDLPASAR